VFVAEQFRIGADRDCHRCAGNAQDELTLQSSSARHAGNDVFALVKHMIFSHNARDRDEI
jgi:hypothetical protein